MTLHDSSPKGSIDVSEPGDRHGRARRRRQAFTALGDPEAHVKI